MRALNKSCGSVEGGEAMHVIGACRARVVMCRTDADAVLAGMPFINGPSLRCIVRTPHGDVVCHDLELYSETVLFFALPAYPAPDLLPTLSPGAEVLLLLSCWVVMVVSLAQIEAQVVVTNDGKTFSNALPFTYINGKFSLLRS